MQGGLGLQVGPLTAEVDLFLELLPGGGAIVHALDHPGFILRAPSEAQALREAPVALWKFGRWLRSHGDRPFRGGPPRVRVVERIAVPLELEPPEAWALFGPEGKAPDPAHVDLVRERWAWAEEDLAALVEPLPPEVLGRPARPGAAPPARILSRLLTLQRAYVAASGLVTPSEKGGSPVDELRALRQAVLAELDRRPREAWGQVRVDQNRGPSGPIHESWSLTKLLRRLLQTQREQVAALRRAL